MKLVLPTHASTETETKDYTRDMHAKEKLINEIYCLLSRIKNFMRQKVLN